MSKEQIKLKTVDIKGKQYVQVHERIRVFRNDEQFKDYRLVSSIIEITDNHCIFKAEIFDQNDKLIANGHARELQSGSYINKTSYIENCETSAIGRALGSLGIGIDSSFASADEVLIAMSQQDEKPKANKEHKPFNKVADEHAEKLKKLGALITDRTKSMTAPIKKKWVQDNVTDLTWDQVSKLPVGELGKLIDKLKVKDVKSNKFTVGE